MPLSLGLCTISDEFIDPLLGNETECSISKIETWWDIAARIQTSLTYDSRGRMGKVEPRMCLWKRLEAQSFVFIIEHPVPPTKR